MLGFSNIPLSLLVFLYCKSNQFYSLRSFGLIPTIKIANRFVFMDNNSFKEDSTGKKPFNRTKSVKLLQISVNQHAMVTGDFGNSPNSDIQHMFHNHVVSVPRLP